MENRTIIIHQGFTSIKVSPRVTLGEKVCQSVSLTYLMSRTVLGILVAFSLFFVMGISSVQAATLSKPANNLGLQLYYSFDEGTSTKATDFSGRGRTGTLVNMAAPATAISGWGNGKLGKALNFDGSNDSVSFTGFTVGTTHTLSVWIKPTTSGDYQGIFTDSSGFNGLFFRGVNNKLTYYFGGDRESTGTVQVGVWTHVAVVSNGTTFTFYINGVNDGSSLAVVTSYTPINVGSALPFVSEEFNGSIDEVRLYDRALTATEVRNLYNTGVIKQNSSQSNLIRNGLLGYWSFDGADMTSTLAYDRSGNNNTGTLLGSGPIKSLGKVGQSLYFDAVDDAVNAGSATGLDNPSAVTISAWIKPDNGNNGGIVSKSGGASSGLYFDVFSSSQIEFNAQYSVTNLSNIYNTSNLVGVWTHVVITWDGSTSASNALLYVNGVPNPATASTQNGVGTRADDSGADFVIGTRSDGGNPKFQGQIDEVRYYNRVLSASEIKTLYNAGAGTKVNTSSANPPGTTLGSGLVGYWSFNGPDLTDKVYDRSSSNDGYFYSGATSTAKTIGKVGQGVVFRNTTPYINAGSPATLDNLNQKTVSFWATRSVLHENQQLVVKNDSGGTSGWYINARGSVFSNGPNTVRYEHNWNSSPLQFAIWYGSTLLNSTSTWYHIAVSYDRGSTSNVPKIYVNGVPDTVTTAQSASGTVNDDSVSPLLFGADGSVTEFHNGKLDEVRIYNRILTDAEVKQLYLMGR